MITPSPVARASRLLYLEIVWSSILGGVITFNAAYLLRLGGSNLDISLLVALPALASVLLSVPAGHFLQSRAHPGRWTLATLAAYWSGLLVWAFVPWVHLGGLGAGALAVIIMTLASIPAQIFSVGIYPLLAKMLPDHHRIHVFAVRAIISACVISVVTFVSGQWLNRATFPGNYQVIYIVGWACGMLSVTHLVLASRTIQKHTAPRPTRPATAPQGWKLWPNDLDRQPDFVRFTLNSLLHNLALWSAAPLYILFFVRGLGANDAWIGLYGTVTGLSTIVGLLFWRWVAQRLREARTARLSVIFVGFMPLLVGLAPNLTFILVVAAVNGFFTGGITVSHINVLLNILPEDRQPQFMGLWSAVQNAGAFVAPLLSVALASRLGLGPTLMVCGLVGLMGAAAHWVWRVPGPLPKPRVIARPEIEGA